jgi:hypothetical protein
MEDLSHLICFKLLNQLEYQSSKLWLAVLAHKRFPSNNIVNHNFYIGPLETVSESNGNRNKMNVQYIKKENVNFFFVFFLCVVGNLLRSQIEQINFLLRSSLIFGFILKNNSCEG